ncbi:hypothetical protein [Methylovulum psychrotolerans]|nr:hypothetical protein [Methylovulum psychrotolerans]
MAYAKVYMVDGIVKRGYTETTLREWDSLMVQLGLLSKALALQEE